MHAILAETMTELERLGTEQNRTVYPRHGVRPPLYGVSYADIGRLQKRIGIDHELAAELWATGNHDARILATRIADPASLTSRQADAWVRDCDNYVVTEALAKLVASSPVGASRARAWRDRKREWTAAAGWAVTSTLAFRGQLEAGECRALIDQIADEIHARPNRVRHEMNGALIAIALGCEDARDRALAAVARIGTVTVDHGRTGCKTPDAASYIRRAEARRRS